MGEDMELTLRMAAIETILFAMGDSVEMSVIAQALEITEEEAEEAVDALEKRCQSPESGLCINRFEDSVQLSSKPEHYEYLVKIAKAPKRAEVENIRGVNSDFAISKLVSYDLVQEMGRKEAPGRPLLFGTTQQFLRSFGIRSLEELPDLDTDQVEEMREEAEQEVDGRLEV